MHQTFTTRLSTSVECPKNAPEKEESIDTTNPISKQIAKKANDHPHVLFPATLSPSKIPRLHINNSKEASFIFTNFKIWARGSDKIDHCHCGYAPVGGGYILCRLTSCSSGTPLAVISDMTLRCGAPPLGGPGPSGEFCGGGKFGCWVGCVGVIAYGFSLMGCI